jgi:prophage regulatory protein
MANDSPPSLLRRRQVEERTGLSCAHLYRQMKDGFFPKPVRIGVRAVAWPEDQIDSWIEQRIAASRKVAA